MNYLKLKQKIYEAIERNPLDRSAYEEMFAVCREYEKIDFQTAHAWNHELRNRISWGLRMTVCSQKFDEAREFDDLMFRSLLFGAQHFFDDYLQAVEYGKPLDKKFYQPRRHYLRRYVDAYQEILDGKLDFLSISMPKRAGKSQLGINFTNMLSGKYPDRATLMEGTGDDLVKSFYLGCLEYLTLPSDYHFYDIFPESKLVQTNADTKIINLLHKSRFPTVMCRSIDARQVGLSEATNLLYLDDCVEGREEAKNRQRLDDKWEVISGDIIGRAIEGTVTVPLTYWMLQLDGTVKCDISIITANKTVLSTTLFELEVQEAAAPDDSEIEKDDDYGILIQLIADVQAIKDAEAKRVTAENGRVSAEKSRVSAENSRVNAETTRVNAEAARVKAEQARVSAEKSRVDVESKRVTAEKGRVDAESKRVAAETARVQAETKRQQDTSKAITDCNTATDSALKAAATMMIVNDDTGKTYQGAIKVIGGKPVFEYDEVVTG